MKAATAEHITGAGGGFQFGAALAVVAWSLQGLLSVGLAWTACQGSNVVLDGPLSSNARIALYAVSAVLLVLALGVLFNSWRSWRSLAATRGDAESEPESREFLAMVGSLAAAALLTGMIWATIPLFMVHGCVSSH